MKSFVHSAQYSNVKTIEFLTTLRHTTGVTVTNFGYLNGSKCFQIIFTADYQSELYLRLKFVEDMFGEYK